MDSEQDRKRLEDLDRYHMHKGDYDKWVVSEDRTHFAGPNDVVRVVNWENLAELCRKSGLNRERVTAAYYEAVETGDILFVFYEEEPDAKRID